ncbi:MAG: type II toxin-antitoxin system mRNA interferase toxin, RelE/StbE family [Nitrospirae bacterium]|uniref:type II toxin-antitoxin system RelE/ParE family toxin n=1 Tax=Candidatus Magnetobacterium casense TaxID=1455061 RepID=UPI000695A5ED|nr:type II toxin-antitoxin system mRNA interferase toxin, RelE/StbE family [Nitrospirota bacterium]
MIRSDTPVVIRIEKVFAKKVKKLFNKNPALSQTYKDILHRLISDPFSPPLKTHQLTGIHKGKYACSLTHGLRIVFTLSDNIIHLRDIGDHDEVY